MIAASAIVWATKLLSKKNALLTKRMLRRVSRLGRAMAIATTEITFVAVDGTGATVVVPTRATNTVWIVRARTRELIAMDLVRSTRSKVMVTATTATTIVAVAGMVETVADSRISTIIAQIAAVVTPSSKAITPAYPSAKSRRGKVMATVTTATTSAVATGTVVTVVQKQTKT